MPRRASLPLTTLRVKRLLDPGVYADGDGLYLQVSAPDSKSWIFRYMRQGRARWMGLGSLGRVSLAEARYKARACREQLGRGLDPIAERDRALQADRIAIARPTFRDCVAGYLHAHEAAWRNGKHRAQWQNTLATYAHPVLGSVAVADIDRPLVMKVLEPIWQSKTETATRVRQRIESVLDWAAARGYRASENPARWKGHLDKLLAKPTRLKRVRHHPALPYTDVPKFVQTLRTYGTTSAHALEFCILTASRTNEVTRAKWSEIDIKGRMWTVPRERMKAGREHRVPLSARAVALLKRQRGLHDEFVFPGQRDNTPLSNMALLATRDRMGYAHITVHGFRSSFRDWAAEQTAHPSEVVEMALAHTIKDKTEAAYRRGDLFEKRRGLMSAWAQFISRPRAQ